jgi:undecaprenyl-diphosphatase
VSEVERAAQFLATHALLLLGLGLLAAAASIAVTVWATHLAARFGSVARHGVATLAQRLHGIEAIRRLIGRTSGLVPSAYVALHLTLGLVIAIAVAVFATLAEEALAAGEMVAFDVAFARALHDARSPAWHRAFSVVSWFGTREILAVATLLMAVPLLLRQQVVLAVGWVGAQAGGGFLNRALKETFARTRPELADPMLAASSWSFPSGHAMGTFILCGMACYLLLRENRSRITVAVVVASRRRGVCLWRSAGCTSACTT